MRRFFIKYVFAAIVALLSLTASTARVQGQAFGTFVGGGRWSLNDGTLTISGRGAIDAEAFRLGNDIVTVIIGEGITEIGDKAFQNCSGLKTVNIPSTVTKIGEEAFFNCFKLTAVNIAEKSQLSTVGSSAFTCVGFDEIFLNHDLTSVGVPAFYNPGKTVVVYTTASEWTHDNNDGYIVKRLASITTNNDNISISPETAQKTAWGKTWYVVGEEITASLNGYQSTITVANADDATKTVASGTNSVTFAMPDYNVKIVASDVTASEYSITLYPNEGIIYADYPKKYYITSDPIFLPTPKKDYHTFLGWYYDENFKEGPVTEIPTGSFGDKHFYAKREATLYSVIIKGDDPKATATPSQAAMGETVTLDISRYDGITTTVTVNGQDCDGNSFTMPGHDVTVHIKHTAEYYSGSEKYELYPLQLITDDMDGYDFSSGNASDYAVVGIVEADNIIFPDDLDCSLILCDGASLTATSIKGANELYISGQEQGSGTLNITGKIEVEESFIQLGGRVTANEVSSKQLTLQLRTADDYFSATTVTYTSLNIRDNDLVDQEGNYYAKGTGMSADINGKTLRIGHKIDKFPYYSALYTTTLPQGAAAGDVVKFQVTAQEGYTIGNVVVTLNDNETLTLGDDGNYTFTMPNKDVVISISADRLFKITCGANIQASQEMAKKGDEISLTIADNAPEGDYVIKVTDEYGHLLQTIKKEDEKKFTMPEYDIVLKIDMSAEPLYTITCGKYIQASQEMAKKGDEITLTIADNAPEGDYVIKVTVENGIVSKTLNKGDVTFTMPGFNITLTLEPVATETVTYIDENGESKEVEAIVIDETGGDFVGDGCYVVKGKVTKDIIFFVESDITIILADGATLTLLGSYSNPLISVYVSKLSVYAQSTGEKAGKLVANGMVFGTSNININGGNISANYVGDYPSVIISTSGISINGGSFTANSIGSLAPVQSPTITINGDRVESFSIATANENVPVTVKRNFTAGINSTIMLPFTFEFADKENPDGTFHSLTGVAQNDDGVWEAALTQDPPIVEIDANTPYIFVPKKTGEIEFTGKLSVATSSDDFEYKLSDEWMFVGKYEKEVWNNRESTIYGFASSDADGKNKEGNIIGKIVAGEFVRAGKGTFVRAMRAYLRYTGSSETFSKSATELPDRIVVVFPSDEDEPNDSTDDIKTPTSEINPNLSATANVWSFGKTIYIASAPMTPYTIVDVNGRLLLHGITATDRDEIHLPGKVDGIVIVKVGGKAYKIRY